MHQLAAGDYVVFILYMLASVGIGVLFVREQRNLKSYFLAGQNMHWIAVGISVIAALFSGISYLGAPAEAYGHDLKFSLTLAAFFIATPVTTVLFLPFFYNLKLYTAYEYLERRFNLSIRAISSALFITRVAFWLGLAIFAPALVLSEVVGVPTWISIVLVGAITTAYTAMGGMKAVIWTDVLQFFVLFGGVVVTIIVAVQNIPGGARGAWELASDGHTRMFDFSLSLTQRVTFWGAFIGGAFTNLVQMATDQVSVQRYLTTPSLRQSQRSLWFKLFVTVPMCLVFYFTGTALYAFYKANPDKLIPLESNDRILPYFVVHELASPIPGILVAAIFAATMSTVSAGINSLTTAFTVDFYRRLWRRQASEDHCLRLAKWLTLAFGALATILAFVASRLGTLVEASNKVMGLLGGPLLGIFFLGILTRRATGPGTLIGAVIGSSCLYYVAFHTEVSFLWYATFGMIVTMIVGYLASLLFPPPTAEQSTRYALRWDQLGRTGTAGLDNDGL